MKNKSKIIIAMALIILVGLATYFILNLPTKEKITPDTKVNWTGEVNNYFGNAKEVEVSQPAKQINEQITSVLDYIYKNRLKVTKSTDNNLEYIVKTIIVEGDVLEIKNQLEKNGFANVAISDGFKKITAGKDGKAFSFVFSVDTTNFGKIKVSWQ